MFQLAPITISTH